MANSSNRDWLQLSGLIGVILGLLLVAYEVRQANRIAKVTTEIGTRSLTSEINEAQYAVPGFSELLVKLKNRNAELTEEELVRANGYVYRQANVWQAIVVAYNNDMLPPASYLAIEDDVRLTLTTYPGLAPMYRKMIDEYPSHESEHMFIIIRKSLDEIGF